MVSCLLRSSLNGSLVSKDPLTRKKPLLHISRKCHWHLYRFCCLCFMSAGSVSWQCAVFFAHYSNVFPQLPIDRYTQTKKMNTAPSSSASCNSSFHPRILTQHASMVEYLGYGQLRWGVHSSITTNSNKENSNLWNSSYNKFHKFISLIVSTFEI